MRVSIRPFNEHGGRTGACTPGFAFAGKPGAAKDRQLRKRLVKILLEKPELEAVLVNVTVRNGNVRLWGVVENADQAAAAEIATRSLPAVKSVENNLALPPVSGVPV